MTQGTAPPEQSMTVDLEGQAGVVKFRVSAKGFYGFCVGTFAALGFELVVLNPASNPQHFMLTLLTGVVAGFLGGTAIMVGRLNDFRERVADKQTEIDRMAAYRKQLEKSLLRDRLSSEDPKKLPPGTSGR